MVRRHSREKSNCYIAIGEKAPERGRPKSVDVHETMSISQGHAVLGSETQAGEPRVISKWGSLSIEL